jgi:hypothetical protein
MTEKRKKMPIHSDNMHFHIDVQEYESKKLTFRHRWGYFVILALGTVIMFLYFRGAGITASLSTHRKPRSPFEGIKPPSAIAPTYSVTKVTIPERTTGSTLRGNDNSKAPPSPAANPDSEGNNVVVAPIKQENHAVQAATTSNSSVVALSDKQALLQAEVDAQIALIRHMKFEEHVVMEKNQRAKVEIEKLQDMLRTLLPMKYGHGPYRLEMKILFPQSMEQPQQPREQTLYIEMAPISLVPYSVYYFLEIVHNWKVRPYLFL